MLRLSAVAILPGSAAATGAALAARQEPVTIATGRGEKGPWRQNDSRSRGGDGKGRLGRDIWSNGSLDIAIGADGAVLAAWTEYHGALWFARSRDGGASFGRPQLVGDPQGRADAPGLALDGAGGLHLVYALHPEQGGPPMVRYTHASAGGGFGPVRTLSAGAAYPALAGDGKDGLAVAWNDIGPAGRPRALGIAFSGDAGHHFTAPAEVPGSAAPPGGSNGSQQGLLGRKLAMDASGQVALVESSLVPGEGAGCG